MKQVIVLFILMGSLLILPSCYTKRNYARRSISIVHASFPGGRSALAEFVAKNTNPLIYIPDSLNYANDTFFEEPMLFTIDSLGNIVDTSSMIWAGTPYTEQDMNHILGKMPKWLPGYRYNNKTKKKEYFDDYGGFSIKYYYESKRQYKK